MKVTFITSSYFLDTVIPLINSLLKHIDIDLIINNVSQDKQKITEFYTIKSNANISENEGRDSLGYLKLLQLGRNNLTVNIISWKNFKTPSCSNAMHMWKLRRLITGDVIHNQLLSSQYYFLISFFLKKRVVLDIHDVTCHSGEPLKYWGKMMIERWVKCADEIIIHNSYDIDLLRKHYNYSRDINVIPFGLIPLVDTVVHGDAFAAESIVLFFGRISSYKGIEYLIKAIPLVKEVCPKVKVILAGKGDYYFDIGKLKQDDTYVIINRYTPNRELAQLIKKASIIVCPYTDATQSGVIMTAYAFNKPVIATNVGGIPEVVEDGITGMLVPPRDPQKLAETIIDLLKNPEKRKNMSENIKKKFNQEDFNWDNIAQKTIEVYKKAIKK